MIRSATPSDFEAVKRLYAQLHPEDPPLDEQRFHDVLEHPEHDLLVLELDAAVVATTYLNVVPNLTRGGRPYAVIENVVVDQARRNSGLGQQMMSATLDRAWAAGCHKAMLQTGSASPATHAFYEASGFSPDAKTAYLARP